MAKQAQDTNAELQELRERLAQVEAERDQALDSQKKAESDLADTRSVKMQAGTQSSKAPQWPFEVRCTNKGTRLPIKHITACDESEAIRLYCMETLVDETGTPSESGQPIKPTRYRFVAVCLKKEREEKRRAQYEAQGYGREGDTNRRPMPSGAVDPTREAELEKEGVLA